MRKTVVARLACRLVCGACLLAAAPFASAAAAAGWWAEHVSPEGDLRLRGESVRVDPGDDKDRGRYRARLGITVEAMDALEFGFRLATGAGDPASRNLDFDESFSLDDVRIDLAYVGWSAGDRLKFVAGKMKNPFFRSGDNALLWDGDYTPEGLVARFASGPHFATAGGFFLDHGEGGDDARFYGVQAGTTLQLAPSSTLTAGVGWFDFTDVAGNAPLFVTNPRGNSLDGAGRYVNDYDVLEVFAEYRFPVRRWPIVVFADWSGNTRAAVADNAFTIGIRAGEAKEPGKSEWSWEWRDTEADAILGVLTDSDLGDGRTGSRGHVLQGGYRLTNHIELGATLILSEYETTGGSPTDFDRVILDIVFSF